MMAKSRVASTSRKAEKMNWALPHPMSGSASTQARLRLCPAGAWGPGERGAAGYEDHGSRS
jgi:hypothetical protein